MRTYIPIADLVERDPAWAERVRERDRVKRRRLKALYLKHNRARVMFLGVRSEAKRKGVEFDLTEEWFADRIKVGVCEMSGLPFNFDHPGHPNTPSVDRRAAGGHYIQANCRMILLCLNRALSNHGEDYVLNVFRHVLARRGG